MTENMKTVCVGRFLVDVPATADVSLSRERVAGFEIETVHESADRFRERVAAREAGLAARGPALDGSGGIVEARDLRVPDMAGRLLVYGRNRGYVMEGARRVDDEVVSVEAHAHVAGVSFLLSARYADEARAALAEAMLARLRLRGEDEIPQAPGFCIGGAIFAEPLPVRKAEHIAMHVGMPGHPDLAMAFASLSGNGAGTGLLARVADIDAQAGPDERLRVTKLRADRRDINGLPGEEVLERIREFNFTTGYNFMWETRGVENDPHRPYLLLELETGTNPRAGGKPLDSSLHEDAVLALWDSISASVRLRQAPAAPHKDAASTVLRLGATVAAGDACPHSGWWRCAGVPPGMAVQGGAVQYLREGERMPQALLLPHQTMWQKLRGVQPSVEPARTTVWTLADKRHRPRTVSVVALAPVGAPAALPDGRGTQADSAPQFATHLPRLGTTLRTGDICQASGWWRCEEPQALDGTRWFPHGGVLPVATFQVATGLFGRAAGPDIIQRRSAWQLVRHAGVERAGMPEAPDTPVDGAPPQAEPPLGA